MTGPTILVEHSPAPGKLDVKGVDVWPTKTLAVGRNHRHHKNAQECFLYDGKIILTQKDQDAVAVQAGDLFIIPADSHIDWDVIEAAELAVYELPAIEMPGQATHE